MTWTYHQASPALWRDGVQLHGEPLYSGHGDGLNNPAMEAVPNVGPIPAGLWRVVRWDEHHGEKGPCVAVLEPVGHDAHGRFGFLVHGDNEFCNHTASDGCIVAGLTIRQAMRASGDMDLEVTG